MLSQSGHILLPRFRNKFVPSQYSAPEEKEGANIRGGG